MSKTIHRTKVKISDLRLRFQIWRDVKNGYIAEDGTPLKCYKCNSKNMENYNKYYEEHWCIEYSVKCKECGTKLGHWAYGNWEV